MALQLLKAARRRPDCAVAPICGPTARIIIGNSDEMKEVIVSGNKRGGLLGF